MMVTAAGELLMLENDAVWQWDAGATWRDYRWASAFLEFPGKTSLTSIRLQTEGAKIRVETPIKNLAYERFVASEPVRLGRLGRHLTYRVVVEGSKPVEYLELGTAELTLQQGT
jgi:hypothetical protein